MTATIAATGPLYSKFGADPDMSELVELFVSEIPNRIETLEVQFAARDIARVCQTAHQIKGAAGSYGFSAITPFAERVETAARANEPEDQIREALDELVAMCRRMKAGSGE